MAASFPTFIATSVVRGSQQGQSHGGVFTVNFETRVCSQHVDWNSGEIDFEGRGADRGLRGIDFDGDTVYIAASDEIFRFDRDFRIEGSFRNNFLKHCHEISRKGRTLFLASTGFDSVLAFDLDRNDFIWGIQIRRRNGHWSALRFDPRTRQGPLPLNRLHINSVCVNDSGLYLSGLKTGALLHIDSSFQVSEVCSLPHGVHNAQPYSRAYGNGVILNDTASDHVRYVGRDGRSRAFKIASYQSEQIEHSGVRDPGIARQGFGRGLCPVGDRFLAAGSSPSTITLYDLHAGEPVASVNLTMDIRNAIHGLEVWPY